MVVVVHHLHLWTDGSDLCLVRQGCGCVVTQRFSDPSRPPRLNCSYQTKLGDVEGVLDQQIEVVVVVVVVVVIAAAVVVVVVVVIVDVVMVVVEIVLIVGVAARVLVEVFCDVGFVVVARGRNSITCGTSRDGSSRSCRSMGNSRERKQE